LVGLTYWSELIGWFDWIMSYRNPLRLTPPNRNYEFVFEELKVVGSKFKRDESEFWQKKCILVILPLISGGGKEFG
jgi:hypothetical protein